MEEYLITSITEINKKKSKVTINYGQIISLYKGEIRKFHIREGENMDMKTYNEIMSDILPKRAKERCLNLLTRRSMAEGEIRKKLREGFYPEDIIDSVVEYLKGYHYINDNDYVENYIESCKSNKSIRRMKMDLKQKGVSDSLISNFIEESDVNEEDNICKILSKKHFDYKTTTDADKKKLIASLMRKGYRYEDIKKHVFYDDICYDENSISD